MFRNLAAKLLGSTPAQAAATVKSVKLEGDFFVLEGQSWNSLSDEKCFIEFEQMDKTGPVMTISCDREGVSERFFLDSVSNLTRFVDTEGKSCFQWIVKKGKSGDSMEEFGFRFDSESQANMFASTVASLGSRTATVIAEFDSTTSAPLSLVERVISDSSANSEEWEVLNPSVSLILSKTKKGEYFLSIRESEDIVFHAAISNSLQIDFEFPLMTFLGYSPLDEDLRVLAVRCEDGATFASLQEAMGVILKESGLAVKKTSARKIRKPAAPVLDVSDASDVSDVDMWEDPSEYCSAPVKSRRGGRRAAGSDDDEDEYRNKHLQTGRKDVSRAVVFSSSRDTLSSGFRVFDTDNSALESISGFNKIALNPSAVMLHQADSKCLILDPLKNRGTVFELDLERGSVVNEWTPGLSTSVTQILPISKNSQSSDERTFLGLNERAIFVMDPRVAPDAVAGNRVRTFNYATNVKLNAAATDGAAHIVVSNKIGQLRLFDGKANQDGELKRAKTLLSGLGDPITHVEVTTDGQWILGTCATYLVLVRAVAEDGTSGFEKSIGASAEPITLALSFEDVTQNRLKTIQFTGAKFDEAKGLIVTSTGSLAVLWDFAAFKRTGRLAYSIKPMHEFILDTNVVGRVQQERVVAMYEHKLELAPIAKERKKSAPGKRS